MQRRRTLKLLAGAVAVPIPLLTGCTEAPPEGEVARSDEFRISDTESWYAGTFYRYKGALVVAGDLTYQSTGNVPVPEVLVAYFDSSGSLLDEQEATFRRINGESTRNVPIDTVSGGDTLSFIAVTEERTGDVESYEITVAEQ